MTCRRSRLIIYFIFYLESTGSKHARTCFCAFYGACRWLAKQNYSRLTLGALHSELLQRIACEAQIEFSELYDDLPVRPIPMQVTHIQASLPMDETVLEEELLLR